MEKLTDLPNIGPVLAGNLEKAGVFHRLRELGAEEAFLRIRTRVDSTACLHQLEALAGAAGALFGNGTEIGNAPVSDEVKAYTGLIQIYALEHGVPEYAELIAAVMMQESGGRSDDPMQASESGFNTEYPKTPGGITDPEYSISVGIQALADCLRMALRSYGGYSELNALEFSDMMAQRMGWPSYGDPQYVQHVLRYYRISDRKK